MDTVSAEQFLLDQVPQATRALFAPNLKLAYDAANLVIKNEPILQVPSAQAGRIRAWAVDHQFRKVIESGQWKADFSWRRFAKPTGNYLEIRLSHSLMTMSLVRDPKKQPRNVVFRANSRLSNQTFLPLPEFADEEKVAGLPSFILVHGHHDLAFAHLGVPNRVHKYGWIHRTPNLLNMPHIVPSSVPATEHTDDDALMTLKEDIDKFLTDHD